MALSVAAFWRQWDTETKIVVTVVMNIADAAAREVTCPRCHVGKVVLGSGSCGNHLCLEYVGPIKGTLNVQTQGKGEFLST